MIEVWQTPSRRLGKLLQKSLQMVHTHGLRVLGNKSLTVIYPASNLCCCHNIFEVFDSPHCHKLIDGEWVVNHNAIECQGEWVRLSLVFDHQLVRMWYQCYWPHKSMALTTYRKAVLHCLRSCRWSRILCNHQEIFLLLVLWWEGWSLIIELNKARLITLAWGNSVTNILRLKWLVFNNCIHFILLWMRLTNILHWFPFHWILLMPC